MENIQSLNEKIGKKMEEQAKSLLGDKEAVFLKYEEVFKKNGLIKVRFSSCDPDGTFTKYEDSVLIVLPGESVSDSRGDVNKYATAKMLTVELPLKIKEIDRNNSRIVCMLPETDKAENMDSVIRAAINKEIAKSLEEGKKPLVWGRIKKIMPNRIIVDLLNQGVIGLIDASHWQKIYTRQLVGMCEVGDFMQFEIIKRAPKREGLPTAWKLSRRDLTINPWTELDYEALSEGGAIICKCTERPAGKSYWWGVSDRLPGIEVMGDYTTKFSSGKTLIEGIQYVCKIREVFISEDGDHKKNRFRVIPFDVLSEDAAKLSAYKQLSAKGARRERGEA